jgi:predicted small secreted protein
MLRRFTALTLLAVFAVVLVGCNTMEGMGEDIEAGGEAIEDAAED